LLLYDTDQIANTMVVTFASISLTRTPDTTVIGLSSKWS
jgi:hypothetical protein